MNIVEAREFVTRHADARYEGHALHHKYLLAMEVIDAHKREIESELAKPPTVLTNPRWNRMQR